MSLALSLPTHEELLNASLERIERERFHPFPPLLDHLRTESSWLRELVEEASDLCVPFLFHDDTAGSYGFCNCACVEADNW